MQLIRRPAVFRMRRLVKETTTGYLITREFGFFTKTGSPFMYMEKLDDALDFIIDDCGGVWDPSNGYGVYRLANSEGDDPFASGSSRVHSLDAEELIIRRISARERAAISAKIARPKSRKGRGIL